MRSASSGLPPGRTDSPRCRRFRSRICRASNPQRRAISSTLQLAAPLQMTCPQGAVGAGGRGVRVDPPGVDLHRCPAIGSGSRVGAGGDDARTVIGVGAGVEPGADLTSEERPSFVAAVRIQAFMPCRRVVTIDSSTLLAIRTGRPALRGERRGDRLHLGVRLTAETSPQIWDYDTNRGDRQGGRGRPARRGPGTGAGRMTRR